MFYYNWFINRKVPLKSFFINYGNKYTNLAFMGKIKTDENFYRL